MTQVLVTRTGSVSWEDRKLLHEAGIIVIETFDADAIRLLEPSSVGVGGSGLLYAALKALNTSRSYARDAREDFASLVFAEVAAARAPIPAPPPQRDDKGRFVKSEAAQ